MSSGLNGEMGDSYLPYHILQTTIFKLERRLAAEPTAEYYIVFYFLHSNTFFLPLSFFFLTTKETAIFRANVI